MTAVQAYVGITDYEWFRYLSGTRRVDEVNFWQPGGRRTFRALQPGELFLFKLHAPRHAIVGGGIFAHATRLPASLAWDAFGPANGASSLKEMRQRIERYRKVPARPHEDYWIGCILLEQPFFLPEELWIPPPEDWHPNIVQGRRYDLAIDVGLRLWERVREALETLRGAHREWPAQLGDSQTGRYGEPILVRPRLGQGSFRVLVTDAYGRRCAVTGERVLPVLEAAHIRPYAEGGDHRVDNGLLVRSDLHTLFDRGYMTVTPEHRLEVSTRIRSDFHNGRHYYELHGERVRVPERAEDRPGRSFLMWHNENAYLG